MARRHDAAPAGAGRAPATAGSEPLADRLRFRSRFGSDSPSRSRSRSRSRSIMPDAFRVDDAV
ncbi:hypothetical protein ACF1GT_23165 [Streptomyces sp. NPDC014636]|uniref:hypothetical protein n=1 Tax=Streptomyces sp. NPDC014636 TaxID=3364876 RepID=UPI0036FDC3F6